MKRLIVLVLSSINAFGQTKIDTTFNGSKMYYHENGNLKCRVEHIKGKPNGLAINYYDDGQIQEYGYYLKTRWIGAYKSFYRNGEMHHLFSFDNSGKRIGVQWYFYENGKVAMITFIAINDETVWIEFDENGLIKTKYITDAKGNKIPPEEKIYEEKSYLMATMIELAKSEISK